MASKNRRQRPTTRLRSWASSKPNSKLRASLELLEDRRVLAGWSGSPEQHALAQTVEWADRLISDRRLVGMISVGSTMVDGVLVGPGRAASAELPAPAPLLPKLDVAVAGPQTRVYGSFAAEPGEYILSYQVSQRQLDGEFSPYLEVARVTQNVTVTDIVALEHTFAGSTAAGDRLRFFLARVGDTAVEQSGTVIVQSNVVAGVTRSDRSNNGLSGDDLPLAGQVVHLFQDDGDGEFLGDTLFNQRMSDHFGRYFFTNLTDGLYFLSLSSVSGLSLASPSTPYRIRVLGGAVSFEAMVDDFTTTPATYVINGQNIDPWLQQADPGAGALAGQRDLLVDVDGQAAAVSATGTIGRASGSSVFNFGTTSPGARAQLQYDGVDVESASGLTNAGNLQLRLPAAFNDGRFRFDFQSIDAGLGDTIRLVVTVRDRLQRLAQRDLELSSSSQPISVSVPVSGFVPQAGTVDFTQLSSIEVLLNAAATPDVDFRLDRVMLVADMSSDFDFSRVVLPTLGGTKWWDQNGNGERETNEPGLPGQIIYLDANDNGEFDANERSTVTIDSFEDDLDGTYAFGEIPTGPYTVRELIRDNWQLTAPDDGGYSVDLNLGDQLTDLDFGNLRGFEFRGVKWLDLNGNLQRDGQVAGYDLLFVVDASDSMAALEFTDFSVGDFDGDGIRDTKLDAELVAVSLLAEQLAVSPLGQIANVGLLVFNESASIVDLNPSDPTSRTTRLNSTAAVNRFRDEILRSLRAQGQTSFGEALATSVDFFESVGGANSRGEVVLLSDGIQFPVQDVPYLGDLARLRGRGVEVSAFGIGTNSPLDHLRVIDRNVTQFTAAVDVIGFFNNRGPGMIFDEPGMAQVQIYIDANNNGRFEPDLGEQSVLTSVDDPATNVDETGTFTFPVSGPGPFVVREVVPAGYTQSLPAAPGCWVVSLTNGVPTGARCDMPTTVQESIEFANRPSRTLSGNVWLDANANRVRDNEAGFRNARIRLTSTTGVTLERTPVADDPATAIDETGNYVFADLAPGIYQLSIVVSSDSLITFPVPSTVVVDLTNLDVLNRNFGVVVGSTLSGQAFREVPPIGMPGLLQPFASVDVFIDLDRDGQWDAGEPLTRTNSAGEYRFNGLLPGNYRVAIRQPGDTWQVLPGGLASSAPATSRPAIVHPATTAGDLTGDGTDELIIVDDGLGLPNASGITVARQTEPGQFTNSSRLMIPGRAQRALMVDWDGDGDVDVVVATVGNPAAGSPETDGLVFLRNQGSGSLQTSHFVSLNGGTMDATAADFNGDGVIDLAATQFVNREVAVLLGQGSGLFRPAVRFVTNGSPVAIESADVNRDGRPDLVAGLADRGAVSIFRNLGSVPGQSLTFSRQTVELPTESTNASFVGTANDRTIANGNSGTADVTVGDLNGDGVPDMAATVFGDNAVFVMLGAANNQQFSVSRLAAGNRPRGVAIADVDGDADADLLIGAGEDSLIYLLANVNGLFSSPVAVLSGQHGETLEIVDANRTEFVNLVHGNLFLGASYFRGRRPYYEVSVVPGTNLANINFHFVVLTAASDVPEPIQLTFDVVGGGGPDNILSDAPSALQIDSRDVNGDGSISPIDALLIINALNSSQGTIATTVRASSGNSVWRLDVNGDGQVSPIDALWVINWLNAGSLASAPPQPIVSNEVASNLREAPVVSSSSSAVSPTDLDLSSRLGTSDVDGLAKSQVPEPESVLATLSRKAYAAAVDRVLDDPSTLSSRRIRGNRRSVSGRQ